MTDTESKQYWDTPIHSLVKVSLAVEFAFSGKALFIEIELAVDALYARLVPTSVDDIEYEFVEDGSVTASATGHYHSVSVDSLMLSLTIYMQESKSRLKIFQRLNIFHSFTQRYQIFFQATQTLILYTHASLTKNPERFESKIFFFFYLKNREKIKKNNDRG